MGLYKDKVEFLLVYIREAHATDGWQSPVNKRDNILYADPTTGQERHQLADTCVRKLDIRFPAVIDNMENTTEKSLHLVARPPLPGRPQWESPGRAIPARRVSDPPIWTHRLKSCLGFPRGRRSQAVAVASRGGRLANPNKNIR
ncbi:MAG: deiodinase-like protein [Gammaproteobacteria bacterium]